MPRAAGLADIIRAETGIEAELVRSQGGAFEITFDGEQIYSKLQTGVFPDQREVLGLIWDRDPKALSR